MKKLIVLVAVLAIAGIALMQLRSREDDLGID
jgi:hypothetical protein